MTYYLTQYWGWIAAAVAAGIATPLAAQKFGWLADLEDFWMKRVAIVFAIPVVLLVMQVITGKPGLLLEAAVVLVIAYVAGSAFGGATAKLLPVQYEGWWVGLFATGLVWLGFAIVAYPNIEPDLKTRVGEVVEKAGVDPLNFDVAGRDVLLPADIEAAKRAELTAEILQVPGVRRVTEVEDLTGAALSAKTIAKLKTEVAAKEAAEAAAKEAEAKAAEEAAAKESSKSAASKKAKAAADAAHDAALKEAAAKEAAAKEAAAKEAAAKEAAAKEAAAKEAAAKEAAAKEAAAKEAAAKEVAAKEAVTPAAPAQVADAAGTIPAAPAQVCQSKLAAVVAAEKITFQPRSAEISKESLPVLEKLGAILVQCPAVTIEVAGHTDGGGKKAKNQALSERRAEAVVASLTKAKIGVGSAKLTAVGYGSAKPIASNDTPEGRANNRRIEFVVK
uniref:OmpA/MotB domain protein n=1 Tax=Rhodopseudomonas palustris (strain BisA53) TaxID=316055 RepID=Q07QP4_RHOP5